MKLDKKLVDEVIRLSKKYFKTNDADYLQSMYNIREILEKSASWYDVKLIEDLVQYTQLSGKGTYDDIYRALAVFGIFVEELENDQTSIK